MNELVSEVRDMLWEQMKTVVNISYILRDNTGHLKLVAYDPKDEEAIIGASGRLENGFLTYGIPDWDFNVDGYLLEDLEKGYHIEFMPITEHYNIWCAIEDMQYDIEHSQGLQEYLKYCQSHDITPDVIASIGLNQVNIMNLYKEKNQGYRIIADYTVNKVAYVIGHDPKAPSPYAVWRTSYNRARGYDIGHYYDSFDEAFSDFRDRIRDEVDKQVYLKRKTFNKEVKRDGAR